MAEGRERFGALRVVLTIAAFFWLVGADSPKPAPGPDFTVLPSTIAVAQGANATVFATTDSREALTLTVDSGSQVVDAKVAPEPGSGPGHPPTYWIITITGRGPIRQDQTVLLKLFKGTTAIVAHALTVTAKAEYAVEKAMKLDFHVDGEAVLDGRTSRAMLTVTNLLDENLVIDEVKPEDGSSSFDVQPRNAVNSLPEANRTVGARQVFSLPIDVSPSSGDPPVPGKHRIGVTVRVHSGPRWSGSDSAHDDVDFSFPGFSQIATVLGVPSLLFLPGLIAVLGFQAMINIGKVGSGSASFLDRLSFTLNPGVWMIAITLSGIFAFLYHAFLLQAHHVERNILYNYDLSDVIQLWTLSLIVGVVTGWIENAGHVHKLDGSKNRWKLAA